ncbi:MAG: HAD family hydrolase [Prevotella sp.]
MVKRFVAALFDLDGVVFDTESQYSEFWAQQGMEYHPELPLFSQLIKGQTLQQIFDNYFNGELASYRSLVTDRLNIFEKGMSFRYVKGFLQFVGELRAHGVKTAVVTSSNRHKMENVYAKCPEFKSLFDEILTAEDFSASKPEPDCYLAAANRFSAGRNECVVFEDSFNGLQSGRAAQMKVVGLATTNAPDAIAPYSHVVISDYTHFRVDDCMDLICQK